MKLSKCCEELPSYGLEDDNGICSGCGDESEFEEGSKLDRTTFKCKCGCNMYTEKDMLLMSNPPQYQLVCTECEYRITKRCSEIEFIEENEDEEDK
jgi:hypothetical protein